MHKLKPLCIIPLRSMSVEIKNKNIKDLNKKPMCMYTICAALETKIFDKIVIASDSIFYFSVIKKFFIKKKINYKNVDFFKRSIKSSLNNSPTELVIKEVLKKYKRNNMCCLIQATSPLLQALDLKKAYQKIKSKKINSLFSGYLTKKFVWKNRNNKIVPLNYNFLKRPMRQKNKGSIVENGAFYFFNTKGFKKYNNRLFEKIGVQLMPEKRSLEIDSKNDFKVVKDFLKKNKK